MAQKNYTKHLRQQFMEDLPMLLGWNKRGQLDLLALNSIPESHSIDWQAFNLTSALKRL